MLLIDYYKPVDVYGNYSTGKSDDYSKTRMISNGPCDVVFAGSLYAVPSGGRAAKRSGAIPECIPNTTSWSHRWSHGPGAFQTHGVLPRRVHNYT